MSKKTKTKTIVLEFEVTAPVGMRLGTIRREVKTRIEQVRPYYDAYQLNLPDTAEGSDGYIKLRAKRYRGF